MGGVGTCKPSDQEMIQSRSSPCDRRAYSFLTIVVIPLLGFSGGQLGATNICGCRVVRGFTHAAPGDDQQTAHAAISKKLGDANSHPRVYVQTPTALTHVSRARRYIVRPSSWVYSPLRPTHWHNRPPTICKSNYIPMPLSPSLKGAD